MDEAAMAEPSGKAKEGKMKSMTKQPDGCIRDVFSVTLLTSAYSKSAHYQTLWTRNKTQGLCGVAHRQ
ncbi:MULTISPECIES: hypothetical protein [unclassified Paraburkholderia]|uniref:hypothetical protein n=1 Tax=unclassified Paraburkholderia TaxID=2615204 RepID=UPI002AAF959E|nr:MULTISPECIES: hypothetical protein [unclassified Paraburkholderia]